MADDLDGYLQSLPDRVTDQISGVIKHQAERLSKAQKHALQSFEQAPSESGSLEASCRAEPGESPLEFIVKAGGDQTTTEVRSGSGEEFDYGLAFEFGTKHQPARPFFFPTYNAMRDDMQREINEAIGKALE